MRVTTWKNKYKQKRKYFWFDHNISSGCKRFYIFILRSIAKEAPGRFLSRRCLVVLQYFCGLTNLDYMRSDICEECVCDKFLQRDYFQGSGLRACKFHSLFYFTGWFPFFVSEFHIDFKGSFNIFGECWWNLFWQPLFLIICSCYHGIRDFRIPDGLYMDYSMDSMLTKEKERYA